MGNYKGNYLKQIIASEEMKMPTVEEIALKLKDHGVDVKSIVPVHDELYITLSNAADVDRVKEILHIEGAKL